MAINLAPKHKMGLPVPNPVLLAGGAIGNGEAAPRGVDLSVLGAVIVGPVTRYPQIGAQPPRLAETVGGMVLNTGLQNRGVSAVLRKFARRWPRLGCPVIVQVADTRPEEAAETVQRLAPADGLSGFELLVAPNAASADVAELVDAVKRHADLPVWIKLPLDDIEPLALASAKAGVDAIVVGRSPSAAGFASLPDGLLAPVEGALFGPLVFPLALQALLRAARLDLELPLIACGGIHTLAQARQALSAGAAAFQIDSAFWIEPGLPSALVRALAESEAGSQQP